MRTRIYSDSDVLCSATDIVCRCLHCAPFGVRTELSEQIPSHQTFWTLRIPKIDSRTNFSCLGVCQCMRAHDVNDGLTPKNTVTAIKTRNVGIPTLMLRVIASSI